MTKLKLASELSQFRLGILGRTLKVVLPSACPVFSWRSVLMVLLPHCPGGCSRGSSLCLQSHCPTRWDSALVSKVSGSYLWWISSRSGQCGSPGVTLCRIRVGTCRLRLDLPSFSYVPDMEASADVDVYGMGGPLDGPTFWLPSSGPFPPSVQRPFWFFSSGFHTQWPYCRSGLTSPLNSWTKLAGVR